MKRRSIQSVVLCLALLAVAVPALGQWAWRDENGRMVYSDRPPGRDVPAERIVGRPRQPTPPPPVPAKGEPAKGEPAAPAAGKTTADQELEFQKRRQQQAEAAKKTDDERARQSRVTEECDRARGYLQALEGGERVARINAQGEREFFDDAQRETEIKRVRQQIATACK